MSSTPTNASRLLSERLEKVMHAWEALVRQRLIAAKMQERYALRDHLPDFLKLLAHTLSPNVDEVDACEGNTVGKEHGAQRAELEGYTLGETLIEYMFLRQAIFEVLEAGGHVLSANERDIIFNSVQHGMVDAATQFSRIELEKEREIRTEVEKNRFELLQERDLRERFVSTLTHDLRTPLTSIKMMADLVAMKDYDKAGRADLSQKIHRQIDRADQMIRNLLDVNLIHAGQKLPLKVAKFDLGALVQATLLEQETTIRDRFSLVERGPVEGYWSADGLRRLLDNLLNNALKYGSADTKIVIGLAQDATTTKLTVHNQGSVMPEAEWKRIFEPFHRGTNAESAKKKGWGLGLTLVRGVVDAHGGSVSVESSLESGTTFAVLLPNDTRGLSSE